MVITCSVLSCHNNSLKLKKWKQLYCFICEESRQTSRCMCEPPFRLFSFPTSRADKEKREKWKMLVNRQTASGQLWSPKKDSRICSNHFVDKEPTQGNPYPSLNLGYDDAGKRVQRQLYGDLLRQVPPKKKVKASATDVLHDQLHTRVPDTDEPHTDEPSLLLDSKMATSSVQLFKRRKVCAVPECGSVSTQNDLLSFHPLPKDDVRLELWMNALDLDEENPPKWPIFVCSKHFISGMKSDFPSHPDFVPSVFPSTTVQEIKALRVKLREFENGFTKSKLEKSCALLRRHWYECGFSTEDLDKGVRRVKSDKRKQAVEEKGVHEAKKLKYQTDGKKSEKEMDSLVTNLEIKQENELEVGSDEFIIEYDRAEEPDEFDLSLVKDEPLFDTESSPSRHFEARPFEHPPEREESTKPMSEVDIKQEPVDDEYDKGQCPRSDKATGDYCDEMLTVHFGNQDQSENEPENCFNDSRELDSVSSSPVLKLENGQQVVQLQNDIFMSVQQAFANQNLGFQNHMYNQCNPQAFSSISDPRNVFSGNSQTNQVQLIPNNMLHLVGQTGMSNQQIIYPNNAINICGQQLMPIPLVGFQSGNQNVNSNQPLGANSMQPLGVNSMQPLGANSMQPLGANSMQPLGANSIQPLGANNIQPLGANSIQPLGANSIQPLGANSIQPLGATLGIPQYGTALPLLPVLPQIPVPVPAAAPAPAPGAEDNSCFRTVVALDPNTYQCPLTNSTTFLVPKENILTLSIGDSEKTKESTPEKQIGSCGTLIGGEDKKSKAVVNKKNESDDKFTTEISKQFNLKPSTSSEEMFMSSNENSCDSLCSQEYQPDSSEIYSDESRDGFLRSGPDSLESDERDVTHGRSPDAEITNSNISRRAKFSSENNGTRRINRNETSAGKKLPKVPHSSEEANREMVSKMCQTKPSIRKEAILEGKLKALGVQVTTSQFKFLLKQQVTARGTCRAFRPGKKALTDCSVQTDMDRIILADLKSQCRRLARELSEQRERYHQLTYDFLKFHSTKASICCHTGCYTMKSLKVLFEYVSICLDSSPVDDLSQFQEFVLTLMKLRLGLHNHDLAFRFEILPSSVPKILTKWISIFANTLCQLVDWPDQEPERTEHRNQRWRLLKLRYDLLLAYDGTESMKDKWFMEQDLDTIIMICDTLNSFRVKDTPEPDNEENPGNLPHPVSYFIEEIVVDGESDDDCTVIPDQSTNVLFSTTRESQKVLKQTSGASSERSILLDETSRKGNADTNEEAAKDMEVDEVRGLTQKDSLTQNKNFVGQSNSSSKESKGNTESENLEDRQMESECSKDSSFRESSSDSSQCKRVRASCETQTDGDMDDEDVSKNNFTNLRPTNYAPKQKYLRVIHVDDSSGVLIGPPATEVEIYDSQPVSKRDKITDLKLGNFIPQRLRTNQSDKEDKRDCLYWQYEII